MKKTFSYTAFVFMILTCFSACEKSVTADSENRAGKADQTSPAETGDSISSVATMTVRDKKFIKTAEINMEVKDVYDATIFMEKSLKDLGGFVTSSQLHSQIMSEETFTISDEKAMMIRKFQTENKMEVRVPSRKLGEFLQISNDKKVFLNSRVIFAEDVTANIKRSKLEAERNSITGKNISKLNLDKHKVTMTDENQSESNDQQIANLDMKDQIEYSTVQIFLKEPQVRVAQIAVTNTQNFDDQFKYNFLYDAKNAVVEGFYLIQKIVVGLLQIWPLVLIGGIAFYFFKKRKTNALFKDSKQ